MAEITAEVVKEHGALQAIMQNTMAIGAILYLAQLGMDEAASVIGQIPSRTRDRRSSTSQRQPFEGRLRAR